MASHPKDSDAATSIAGHASSVHEQGATTPARRVLSTTWRGQNIEVTLPYPEHPIPRGDWWEPGDISHYIYSTASPKDPNFPRAFQHLPEGDRHKRWTDINNPYVRIQKPTRPEPPKSTMTGGPSLLGISKQRARTSKRPSTYNESSRQSSLLDTDIGMEGWPVAGTSSSNSGMGETKQELNDEAKTETAMGQLLDLAEDNPKAPEANVEEKEAPKKSLLQQLYELQGLEAESVTTTTTTTTTVTSIKTKPASATTSSGESMKEPTQTTPQIMTPVSEDQEQTEEPIAAVPANGSIIKTPVSQYTPTTLTTHSAIYTPSTSTTAIPQPSSPPSPTTALETLRSQELALETHTPLGTEISTWAAAATVAAPPSSHYSNEAGDREGGYIKRFTTPRNQVSDAEPNKDNTEPDKESAMVKWDPFGGLWGYAASKKVWVVPKKEEVQEEKTRKEKQQDQMELKNAKEEKFELEEDVKQNLEEEVEQKEDLENKYKCFDNELETFWTKRDEKEEENKEVTVDEEQGKQHSYFDELERFMNS